MERANISLLVVNDADLNCSNKLSDPETINKIDLGSLNFQRRHLDPFDMIVYRGSLGSKVLKSKYTDLGIIKKK